MMGMPGPGRICDAANKGQDIVGQIYKIAKDKGYKDIELLCEEILVYLEKIPGRRSKREYD